MSEKKKNPEFEKILNQVKTLASDSGTNNRVWDYKVITHKIDRLEFRLQRAGEEGWELVTVIPDSKDNVLCFFKKDITETEIQKTLSET